MSAGYITKILVKSFEKAGHLGDHHAEVWTANPGLIIRQSRWTRDDAELDACWYLGGVGIKAVETRVEPWRGTGTQTITTYVMDADVIASAMYEREGKSVAIMIVKRGSAFTRRPFQVIHHFPEMLGPRLVSSVKSTYYRTEEEARTVARELHRKTVGAHYAMVRPGHVLAA